MATKKYFLLPICQKKAADTPKIGELYRGMMIAIPDERWIVFQQMSISELVIVLQNLAENIKLFGFRKHPGGPKKPQPKRKSFKNSPPRDYSRITC